LSFGQDKVIDVVSGGAIVQRNSQYILRKTELIDVPFFTQLRDRIYPMITWLVRKTYAIGLGKIIHKVAKNTGLLQSPVLEKEQANRALPNSYHGVIYNQFQKLELLSQHRKKIADIYASEISSEYTYNDFVTKLNNSANLRFPLRISNRDSLVQYLQDRGIYISDIWYDAPIAPKKYLGMVPYNNECPQAAETSGVMVNLPTHCNISIDTAYTISRHINQWIQSQDAQ